MLLWRLWRAIQNPPWQQPIYRRGLLAVRLQSPRVTGTFFPWMMMLAGIGFCSASTWSWLPNFLIVGMFLINIIYALTSGAAVSHAIATEKMHNRYPLLASSPAGTFGLVWATCVTRLHRRPSFAWVPFFVRLISIVVTVTLFVIVLLTLFVASAGNAAQSSVELNNMILQQATGAVGLVVLFCFDHFYSLVTAAMFGMLMPIDEVNPYEAQIRSLSIFLVVQLIVYMVCFVVFFSMQNLGLPGVKGTLEQIIVTAGVYILLREVILRWLWRVLVNHLNAAMPEAESILQTT